MHNINFWKVRKHKYQLSPSLSATNFEMDVGDCSIGPTLNYQMQPSTSLKPWKGRQSSKCSGSFVGMGIYRMLWIMYLFVRLS